MSVFAPRHVVLELLAVSTFLGVGSPVPAAPADAYEVVPSRGRTRPDAELRRPGVASWAFTVAGGASAAGDLFRVKAEQTEVWTAPVSGETFPARRFTATLDEDVLFGFGLARRMTSRGWLRVEFSWTENGVTALANDTQFVTLVPYDTLTQIRLGLTWEQRLLDAPLAPYAVAGLGYLDASAKADFLSQNSFAPVLGLGAIYELSGAWQVRGEVSDTIVQLDAAGITQSDWPDRAVAEELGPQHLFALTLGLVVLY